jgi:hypothetical protein
MNHITINDEFLRSIDKAFNDCQEHGFQNCQDCTLIECCDNAHHGLKVFSDDYTTVIAKDEKDAAKAYCEFCGDDPEKDADEYEFEPMTIDLDQAKRLWLDEDMDVRVIKTWRRWIKDTGRGFLASTEY